MATTQQVLRQKLMERAMAAYDREGPVGADEVRKRLEAALRKMRRTATELQLHLLNIHERKWLFRHLLVDFDGEDLAHFAALCWHLAEFVLAIKLEELEVDVFGPQMPMVKGWLSEDEPSETMVLATTASSLGATDPMPPIAEFLSEYTDAEGAVLFVWPSLADVSSSPGAQGTRPRRRAKSIRVVDGETLTKLVLLGMDVEEADATIDDLDGRYGRARTEGSKERVWDELCAAKQAARRLRSQARKLVGLPPLEP